jgi:hypothetical protein
MCGGSPKSDSSAADAARREAEEARRREEERKQKIQLGQTHINNTFDQFNDDYFDARRQAYLDYATPQLDDQYGKAKDNITYNLARAGNTRSQSAIDTLADLSQKFDFQNANMLTEGDRQRQSLRDRVENERQTLFDQLNASADPDAAANQALTRSRFISDSTPDFSPLGALFQNVALASGQNYLAGKQYAANTKLLNDANVPSPGLPGVGGSGRVYN